MIDLYTSTTVGVCDTQPVTAAGVRTVLGTCLDLEFLWAANTLEEAVRLARQQPPRVVLADKGLGANGLIHWILDLRSAPVIPALVIWGSSLTEGEALRFVRAGAKGVIRKAASPEALVACLRSAGKGTAWMEDNIFRSGPKVTRGGRSSLTPRETQVFGLVEQGLTNCEIARELGIRPGTVKIHLKHLYEKTGIRSRYHLALSGLKEKGLLSMTA
jgi:two-component system nitrate/nitrite response regulator NarL